MNKIEKADRASDLYHNPLIQEALQGIEDTIFYNFKTSHYKKADEREDLYKQMQVIEAFKKIFEAWIIDGKAERNKLELRQVI